MLDIKNISWSIPEYTASFLHVDGIEKEKTRNLYYKGEAAQWKTTDLDWEQQFNPSNPLGLSNQFLPLYNSKLWNRMSDADRTEYSIHHQGLILSNLLNGEVAGAMIIGKLITVLPTNDDRYFMSTQLSDEYRHAVIIDKFIDERIKVRYGIKSSVEKIAIDSITDSKWDVTFLVGSVLEYCGALNLQVISSASSDNLTKVAFEKMYIDEARHVAYSNVLLDGYYSKLSSIELKEREQLIIETIHNLKDLINYEDLRINLGLPKNEFNECCGPIISKRLHAVLSYMRNWLINIGLFTDTVKAEYVKLGIL
jgi:hypothetical protein